MMPARFLAKFFGLFIVLGIGQSPEGQKALLLISQKTLRLGAVAWNKFATHWNTGGKKHILDSLAHNRFIPKEGEEGSEQFKYIRQLADATEKLPLIEFRNQNEMALVESDGNELLKVEKLDELGTLHKNVDTAF